MGVFAVASHDRFRASVPPALLTTVLNSKIWGAGVVDDRLELEDLGRSIADVLECDATERVRRHTVLDHHVVADRERRSIDADSECVPLDERALQRESRAAARADTSPSIVSDCRAGNYELDVRTRRN